MKKFEGKSVIYKRKRLFIQERTPEDYEKELMSLGERNCKIICFPFDFCAYGWFV